jgi:hypothetical protein
MHKALALVPSTKKRKEKENKAECVLKKVCVTSNLEYESVVSCIKTHLSDLIKLYI